MDYTALHSVIWLQFFERHQMDLFALYEKMTFAKTSAWKSKWYTKKTNIEHSPHNETLKGLSRNDTGKFYT